MKNAILICPVCGWRAQDGSEEMWALFDEHLRTNHGRTADRPPDPNAGRARSRKPQRGSGGA